MLACLIIIAVLLLWNNLILCTIEDEIDDALDLIKEDKSKKYLDFTHRKW